MTGIRDIGVSALLSFQRALNVTGHNIANANTPGFSRQTVQFAASNPTFIQGSYIGTGVRATSAERVVDEILIGQLRGNVSVQAHMEAYHTQARDLDKLFADESVSIETGLQQVFDALQSLSNNPSSIPARQVLLNATNALVNRFETLDAQIENRIDNINNQLSSIADTVTGLAQNIASLNNQISLARGNPSPPNDLLDQREGLLRDLSELVPIRTVDQGDGAVNVFLSGGLSLVLGGNANALTTVRSESNINNFDLAFQDPSGNLFRLETLEEGGKAAGLVEFRNDLLTTSDEALNKLALIVSDAFNQQHQLGMSLDGTLGQNFFSDINGTEINRTRVSADSTATGNAIFSVAIDDTSLLTGEKYRLSYEQGTDTYTLADAETGGTISTFTGADLPESLGALGFTISLDSGAPADGDVFYINPTNNGISNLEVAITDARDIAAALPVTSAEATNNSGDASVNIASITNRSGNNLLAAPITLTYDSALNQFTASTGETFAYDPLTDSGSEFSITVAGSFDINFSITNEPENGDQFIISNNSGASGDNRNVLSLIGLDDMKTVNNGESTFRSASGQLIAQVGARTLQADLDERAAASVLRQSQSLRDSISGVNMDEEAANLLKYEQAYQAASQVISVSNSIFATLMQAISR